MRKFISFLSISILGGAVALIAYTQWIQPKLQIQNNLISENPIIFPVNYLNNSNNDGSNVDFTTAAEKTLHAVVPVSYTHLTLPTNREV